MKQSVLVKDKKYSYLDCLVIPFKFSPGYTILAIVQTLIKALFPAITVLAVAGCIDTALEIVKTGYTNAIWPPLLVIFALKAYDTVFERLLESVALRHTMCVDRGLQSELINKRAKLKASYVENNDTWDLITRVCDKSTENLMAGLNNLLSVIEIAVTIFSVIGIIIAQAWWTVIVICAFAIPTLIVSRKMGKRTYKAFADSAKTQRRAKAVAEIAISRDASQERAMYGYSEEISKQWFELYDKSRRQKLSAKIKNSVSTGIVSILMLANTLLISFVFLFPLKDGAMGIGMFIACINATNNLINLFGWRLANVVEDFSELKKRLQDLTEFVGLEEQTGALDRPSTDIGISKVQSIEFKNVTFSYPNTELEILKKTSFKIEGSKQFAFVGINGAGKTTITKLLTKQYDNYSGEIYINGKDLRTYTLAEIKSLFCVVYQDYAKYSITLADNILLGNVNNGKELNLRGILDDVELSKQVDELPSGVNTHLGKIFEDGQDLSGGQWQRVALARALANPAPIRILDEPTAALDPIAESHVYDLFGKVSRKSVQEKFTIFITHRLGAAKLADEILVLDDGKIIEQGNHDDLVAQNGQYAQMFEAQRSWYVTN